MPVICTRHTSFSGADLANLVNEACYLPHATTANKSPCAILKKLKTKLWWVLSVLHGHRRRARTHCLSRSWAPIVGLNCPEHDPVYKVSIISRGRALGVMYLPEQDRYSYSNNALNLNCAYLVGVLLKNSFMALIRWHRCFQWHWTRDRNSPEYGHKMGLDTKTGPINYGSADQEISSAVKLISTRTFLMKLPASLMRVLSIWSIKTISALSKSWKIIYIFCMQWPKP